MYSLSEIKLSFDDRVCVVPPAHGICEVRLTSECEAIVAWSRRRHGEFITEFTDSTDRQGMQFQGVSPVCRMTNDD